MCETSAAAPAPWRHPEFRRGAREMAGVALGISAWGVVAGVAMANSSLGATWAIVMSLVVFSGTGRIASLPLLGSGAPLWVLPMPAWLTEGLRYAPLAAMVAVVAPEIVMTQGQLITTWKDALYGAAAATGWYFWRRDMFGTIVAGTAVMLALRLTLDW